MRFFRIILIFSLALLASCAERYSTRKKQVTFSVKTQPKTTQKTGKKVVTKKEKTSSKKASTGVNTKNLDSQRKQLINTAMSYLGTPYKYGGTTRKGFDCSGFVNASFKPLNISLHRSSDEMANQGVSVQKKNLKVGDLLFFVTGKSSRISHVGIVVETGSEIKFIHSSTSKGVIISSLSENYWSKAYRKAKRVIM